MINLRRLLFCATLLLMEAGERANTSMLLAPTDFAVQKEGAENHNQRNLWFETMHRSHSNTDWRWEEYQNQIRHSRLISKHISLRQECGNLNIGESITGSWVEKGSVNQAGSVLNTAFDAETDQIWLISAGGSLWKGDRFGNEWEVVNDKLRFSEGLLEIVPFKGEKRILAFIYKTLHFSDDMGKTWHAAEGFDYKDKSGNFKDPLLVWKENETMPILYVLVQPSENEKVQLLKSVDFGTTFSTVTIPEIDNLRNAKLIHPHFSDKILLAQKTENSSVLIWQSPVDPENFQQKAQDNAFDFGQSEVNLAGWQKDTIINLYAYRKDLIKGGRESQVSLYFSKDLGENWEKRGTLYTEPWEVGVFISKGNPSILYYGEIDCFRSIDNGKTWEPVNYWWEYYRDVTSNLHADIMDFGEFQTKDGVPFILVSHHGGLSVSYDQFKTQTNLGLRNLNVGQYYNVHTSGDKIFAGSQDQGFQIAVATDQPDPTEFSQILTGDFNQILKTPNGNSLWVMYIGGWVGYFEDIFSNQVSTSFNLESKDEILWFPPIINLPESEDHAILMGGGNVTGGEGSYLIELKPEKDELKVSQGAFNFMTASDGGALSALAISPVNHKLWYCGTSNGRFFYSPDAGQTWTKNGDLDIKASFLYGQVILPSNEEEQTVYFAGSGYDNPPVYISKDNGFSFQPLSNGLPPTLVYDMAFGENEEIIFAATEAGPFVYLKSTDSWHEMGGGCVPNQSYWAVEYLKEKRVVRFATFGRGIWDFKLAATVSVRKGNTFHPAISLFPNPTTDFLNLSFPKENGLTEFIYYRILDGHGKVLKQEKVGLGGSGRVSVKVQELPAGLYYIEIHLANVIDVKKFLVVKN